METGRWTRAEDETVQELLIHRGIFTVYTDLEPPPKNNFQALGVYERALATGGLYLQMQMQSLNTVQGRSPFSRTLLHLT